MDYAKFVERINILKLHNAVLAKIVILSESQNLSDLLYSGNEEQQ